MNYLSFAPSLMKYQNNIKYNNIIFLLKSNQLIIAFFNQTS
ncbi:hypothetical protein [Spiroplasma endosymbiont of Zeiraphera isertana]